MAEVVPTADPVKRRLELDAAAEMVRSSYTSARNEEERFIVADKALARYDQLLAAWKDEPSAQNDVRRARIDRMGALLVRKRTAEVIRNMNPFLQAAKYQTTQNVGWHQHG
jgi:biofilm PGA synthesis protein PgaA